MARFDQRESGYWQARVRRKGWKTQSKTFRTKTDAEAWARSVESAMDRGSFVSSSVAERTLFQDIADRFAAEFAPHHYRGAAWRYKLDRLVNRLGQYSIASLTQERVAQYRDQRLEDPDPRFKDKSVAPKVSGATVKTELDLLSKVLDVASKEFGVALHNGNPVSMIRKPVGNKSRDRRLTTEQLEALLTVCGSSRNTWLKPAVQLSIETAMRQGELLALRWEDVDLAKRVAFLRITKNGESRAVPLASRAIAVLESIPRAIKGQVIPQEKQGLYAAFITACKRAEIEDFHWHDLRHEALSRLAERGDLSVLELSAISGHKTLRLVQLYVQMHATALAQKLG
jgi:integrase